MMKRFSNVFRLALCVSVLAVTLSVPATRAAGPPAGLDVNVVNTPLPVTGSVTGTIGLAPGTSVQIDNPVGNPVRVRNVNDAIQPVQASGGCSSTSGTVGCVPASTFYTVPAGKRLVIEYASLDACILPGQSAELSIFTTAGGVFARHAANIAPAAAGPGATNFSCNPPSASSITAVGQQVRLYADAGTFVAVEADRNSATGTALFFFSISGYLVDVPLTP